MNIPLPRRDWSDWLDRPAWWYLDGLVVYGHLERIDETTRGQRLALVVWDQPEAGRGFYFNQRHVLKAVPGEPVYACGRRLTEPRE